ncbi:ABC transporter permease [Bacillus sp. PK3_68]|uniref:ABC transporter permease n=1 Tax=Bacillus sp. PK3_68 TaxID=2027408 RepID=UPI000E72643B|nr:ABC transporter permease [Bacillus sp. PK3_68]RJS60226.1 permease [Bacillus sp. PK3_68]
MMTLMQAEFAKIKRKGFLILSFLGGFGVVALQMVNYGVRKEWLMEQNQDHWGYYLMNVQGFIPLAIVLGSVILAVQIAGVEEETNAWKQQLALPLSKKKLYAAKFFVVLSYLILASVLLMIFTLIYGMVLNFDQAIPYEAIARQSILPVLAVLPIVAVQLWISVVSKSQSVAITTGIVQFLLTYSAFSLPDWMPWKWINLLNPTWNVGLGISVGGVVFLMGMYDFYRKDAK